MEAELVGEHEPPMRKGKGVTNLLPSAQQTGQVGWSRKASRGGEWEDKV